MDLTIVIPAVNEAGNIQQVITDTESAARKLNLSFEILVVDGGSQDGTAQLAGSCGDFVRVAPQKRPGYGGAIREGLEQAKGEFILTMDADLSHDPSHEPPLGTEIFCPVRTKLRGSNLGSASRRKISVVE